MIELRDLRKSMGLKQKNIRSFKQASVSKIESREDIKVSTLMDYIHALGLDLEIWACGGEDDEGAERRYLLMRTESSGKNKDKKRDKESRIITTEV